MLPPLVYHGSGLSSQPACQNQRQVVKTGQRRSRQGVLTNERPEFLIRPKLAKNGEILSEDPIDLDGRRGV
jgi:hypothetical protein